MPNMFNFIFVWSLIALLFICNNIPSAHAKAIVNSDDETAWYAKKLSQHETKILTTSRVHVLRLGPGEDLLESLFKYARVTKIRAMSLVSVVGSLTDTNIRYANEEGGAQLKGHFEIVSLVGNIDFQNTTADGYAGYGHVHIACSDEKGVTIGGHLLSGNLVYTTAEITMLEMVDGLFKREPDLGPNGSGYYELKVYGV